MLRGITLKEGERKNGEETREIKKAFSQFPGKRLF
jgi:hypothetical protein